MIQKFEKPAILFLTGIVVIKALFLMPVNMVFSQCSNRLAEKKITKWIEEQPYQTLEGKYATIYFTQKDSSYVNCVIHMADTYYPLLLHDFGQEDCGDLKIVLYPNEKMLCNVLGVSEKEVPMGAYYGGILHILSPNLWIKGEDYEIIERFMEDGPIIHEMVHFVLDKKLSGNYDLWMTEGIALYFERKYTGFEWRPDLEEASKSITLQQLEKQFQNLDESKAYRRSYDLIQSLENQYGEKAIISVLNEMQKGQSFSKALKKLSFSIEGNK